MDNLTHSLVGAALGRAGLYKCTRLAAGALIIGANLPDIDVLGLPFGANLAFRRGITHGPVAMMMLPFLLTGALMLWARWRPSTRADAPPVRYDQLLLLSYIGVWSHPALDWLNNYGVRLLYPFSDRWFYGDSIFIIDPWIWLALGTGVLWSRRRARADTVGGISATAPARVAVTSVAAYIALMIGWTGIARSMAHNHIAEQGTPPQRVMAGPVPFNPVARTVIADMGREYRLGRVDVGGVAMDTTIPTNAAHPAVQAAVASGAFRDFLYWSRFPLFQVDSSDGATWVTIGDARFVMRGVRSSFSERVQVDAPRRGN